MLPVVKASKQGLQDANALLIRKCKERDAEIEWLKQIETALREEIQDLKSRKDSDTQHSEHTAQKAAQIQGAKTGRKIMMPPFTMLGPKDEGYVNLSDIFTYKDEGRVLKKYLARAVHSDVRGDKVRPKHKWEIGNIEIPEDVEEEQLKLGKGVEKAESPVFDMMEIGTEPRSPLGDHGIDAMLLCDKRDTPMDTTMTEFLPEKTDRLAPSEQSSAAPSMAIKTPPRSPDLSDDTHSRVTTSTKAETTVVKTEPNRSITFADQPPTRSLPKLITNMNSHPYMPTGPAQQPPGPSPSPSTAIKRTHSETLYRHVVCMRCLKLHKSCDAGLRCSICTEDNMECIRQFCPQDQRCQHPRCPFVHLEQWQNPGGQFAPKAEVWSERRVKEYYRGRRLSVRGGDRFALDQREEVKRRKL